jgi:hypothetical protein
MADEFEGVGEKKSSEVPEATRIICARASNCQTI